MHVNRNTAESNPYEYDVKPEHGSGITPSDTIASSSLSLIVDRDLTTEELEDDSLDYSSQFALPVYRFRNDLPSQGFTYCEAIVEFLDRMHREDVDIFPILPSNDPGRQNTSAMSFLNRLMENDLFCSPKIQGVGSIARRRVVEDLHACGYLEIGLSVISGETAKREDVSKIQLGSPNSPRAIAAREQRELEVADGPIAIHGKKKLVEDSNKLLHVDRLGLVDLDKLMQSKNAIYLCRKVVSRFYYLPGGDENDLMQAAHIGMAKAFRDYESGHDSEFWNFAELCVTRQVVTEFKAANREKNVVLTDASRLEAPSAPPSRSVEDDLLLGEVIQNPTSYDPLDVVAASEAIRSIFHIIESGLSEIEKASFICVDYMGFSYEEAVEYMSYNLGDPSLDRKAVDNALQRVRRKIKQQVSID